MLIATNRSAVTHQAETFPKEIESCSFIFFVDCSGFVPCEGKRGNARESLEPFIRPLLARAIVNVFQSAECFEGFFDVCTLYKDTTARKGLAIGGTGETESCLMEIELSTQGLGEKQIIVEPRAQEM
jgi:hypothetical protein